MLILQAYSPGILLQCDGRFCFLQPGILVYKQFAAVSAFQKVDLLCDSRLCNAKGILQFFDNSLTDTKAKMCHSTVYHKEPP